MIKKFLKIAGVKTEEDFYKKYPSEAAFFKAHPEAKDLKKYKQGGEQKKLIQLTDFGGVPKAQKGITREEKAATTEFGKDRKCGITSANEKGYKEDLKFEGRENKIAEQNYLREQEAIAKQKAQEWADFTNVGLDPYGEKYGKKDKTFMENYNRFIGTNPAFVQEQSTLGVTPEQRYAMLYKMSSRSGSPTFAATNRLKSYMGLKPEERFTDQQLYEAVGKMGGIDKYAEWWKSGYPEIKQQKKGGKVPKLQNAYPTIPNTSDPLLWGSTPPISGTAQTLPMSNPNAAPMQMDPRQTGTFQQQLAGSKGAVNPNASNSDLLGKLGGAQGAMDMVGQVAGIIGKFKEQKENLNKAKQFSQVADIVKKAAGTRPEPVRRKYDRPEDYIINPNEMFPTYGVGTNYLAKNGSIVRAQDGMDVINQIGGNPTEVQNMYNPGTLYDDLGFEPLGESEIIKQYAQGGFTPRADGGFESFASSSGGQQLSSLGGLLGSVSGGSQFGQTSAGADLGGMLGGVAGQIFGGPAGKFIGKFAGGLIGGALDQKAMKTEKLNKQGMKDMQQANLMQAGQNIQNQYSAFVRDGGLIPYSEGWMSHDWQPQVITQFGEHSVKDLLKDDPMMDTLSTGGRITQNNMFPQDKYAFGGELKTTWGGYAEPVSQNPYLPGTGETVMFRGKSHEEADGKGHTGIGVKYGDGGMTDYAEFGSKDADADVEVERGEPAVELMDGNGEKNMVVYGNLQIPNSLLHEIGDPNAKGKKFKTYVADLAKKEDKQSKLIDKAIDMINNADASSISGKLKYSTGQAILQGANAKLQQYSEFKKNAAGVQSALNETAEEQGLVADDLAKGKITMDRSKSNQAKWGAKLETAQTGKNFSSEKEISDYYRSMGYTGPNNIDSLQKWIIEKAKTDPNVDKELTSYLQSVPITNKGKKLFGKNKKASDLTKEQLYEQFNDKLWGYRFPKLTSLSPKPTPTQTPQTTPQTPASTTTEEKKSTVATTTPLQEPGVLDYLNMLQPYLIPTDAEQLDPAQLYPEMYAIATNQLEPVQAQLYQQLLQQPFDISLQDQLNEITAQEKSAERLARNNPEALANIYAQTRAAKDKVLGEQFRANQAMKASVYNANRQELNNAHLKNLEILDNQYVRQAQAKTATKEVGQSVVNSIASKILNNKLENRTLQVYENMYNYRFDPRFRAINYNPLAQFNIPEVGKGMVPIYDKDGNLIGYQQKDAVSSTDKTARNGSIIKALKNL